MGIGVYDLLFNTTIHIYNTRLRPADVYVPLWDLGGAAALDFAVTSGLRNDLLEQTAADGSSCLTQYENFRNAYLNSAEKRE